eukprot:CAMPEP_0176149710 /NCGR_PEP_ID=MMETSP0120_2-20121206/76398_1 /TAXON_ID=160619 /ORGANISM="Kryptoperidinium foliaceum, Strain CCMP 1326" /LENGTH=63 /DNA_ID=CAMNT_0017486529 /DNA_START=1 /DNA_END=189 /DNA_ORIENTATION=+
MDLGSATPFDADSTGSANVAFGIGSIPFGMRYTHVARADSWFGVRFPVGGAKRVMWARVLWDP